MLLQCICIYVTLQLITLYKKIAEVVPKEGQSKIRYVQCMYSLHVSMYMYMYTVCLVKICVCHGLSNYASLCMHSGVGILH